MGDGLAGLLDVLGSHKIVATVAVPAAMAKVYPKAVEAVLKRGHEVAAEGLFHEDVSQLPLEDERARMKDATAILSGDHRRAAGRLVRPATPRRQICRRRDQSAHDEAAARRGLRLHG